MQSYIYDEYLGNESLEIEYKEFTFNLAGLNLDMKQATQYCETNEFVFNDDVINNIKKYFKTYLPKYVSGFLNSRIDGTLYFGVNDNGFIRGIPYLGEIDIQYLINKINYYYYEYTNVDTNVLYTQIYKIEKPNKPTQPYNSIYLSYLTEKDKYIEQYTKFKKDMNNWHNRFTFYNQRLTDLVNNKKSRQLIIEYIKKIEPQNSVIDLLNTNYKMKYYGHEEVSFLKESKMNPYYWVTKWKDEMTEKIKNDKPSFYSDFNKHLTPLNIIMNCTDMIPYWYYNNNLNLYLIKIDIKGSNNTKIIKYYNNKKKENQICCRTMFHGEPVCYPY
jgi:hypothetical protein